MLFRHWLIAALACAAVIGASHVVAIAGTTGAISGTTSDGAGHPLDGVQVSAVAPSGTAKTVSGGNGFYALNGLSLDTYTLTFVKVGYQTATIPGVTIVQDQTRRVDAMLQTGLRTLGTVTVRSMRMRGAPRFCAASSTEASIDLKAATVGSTT